MLGLFSLGECGRACDCFISWGAWGQAGGADAAELERRLRDSDGKVAQEGREAGALE